MPLRSPGVMPPSNPADSAKRQLGCRRGAFQRYWPRGVSVASRSIGAYARVAQHRYMATAQRAGDRTAPRAGAGAYYRPSYYTPPATQNRGGGSSSGGLSSRVGRRFRVVHGRRTAHARTPLPAKPRSRRWPTPSVVTSSSATLGTIGTVPRRSCTVC